MPEETVLSTPLRDYTPSELPNVYSPEIFTPSPVQQEEAPSSSMSELLNAAKDTTWVVRDADAFARVFKSYEDGPSVTEDDWKSLSDEWDKDQLDALRDLVDEGATREEWEDMLEEFTITNTASRTVAENGLKGVAAQFGTALFDPTFLGATAGAVATGNVLGASILSAQKAGRLTRLTAAAAKAGFTAAAPRTRLARVLGEAVAADGVVAGLRSQTTNDYSDEDAMIDMLATVAAVGVFDGPISYKMAKTAQAVEAARTKALIDEAVATATSGRLDAGAMQAKGTAGPLRFDDYGILANSDNTEVRFFAENGLQDAVGGGSHSAAALAAMSREHSIGEANAAFLELWDGYKKTIESRGMFKDSEHMQGMSEKLWETIVMDIDHGPEFAKAAQVFRKQNGEILTTGQDANIHGLTDVEQNPNYMKQEWSTHAWRSIQSGSDGLTSSELTELVHRGLNGFDGDELAKSLEDAKAALAKRQATHSAEASDTLDVLEAEVTRIEDVIAARKRLAMGFTNRMIARSNGEPFEKLSELLEDPESLVKWLREDPTFATSSEEEIKEMVSKALNTRSNTKSGVIDRAKRRISIDPSATYTKNGRVHRVADLMNRDALGLQQSYIHEMTGHIALAKRLDIKSPREWNEFKTRVHAKEIELRRADKDADKKAAKVLDQLEEMKREIYGHNRYELTSDAARMASVLMKYNFMTTMGKAAFSATSELGRILAENRTRNVLKMLPMMHKVIVDSFRNVTKHTDLLKEVNSLGAAIGDDHLLRFFNSFDETGVREGSLTTGMLAKAELVAHRGARLMAKASLLAPMDKTLRFISLQSSVNSLYEHLIKGKKARLAFDEIGLSQDMRWRIKANMQQHGVETDAFGNVKKLNIHKWDRQTADDFMLAMTVNNNRQVQKTFAGENTMITSHPWGRVFLQFRKFAIDSYAKHLRADIRSARNGNALRVLMSNIYAIVFAAAGITARVHSSTVGMDEEDRKKVLEEKLGDEKRFASSVASYTPALGPVVSLWNTTLGWAFPERIGEGGLMLPVSRASGLDNTGFGANPSFNTLGRFRSMFHDITNADPENMVGNGRYAFPLQNTIWGDVILNNAASAIK